MTTTPIWRRYARLFGPDPAADVKEELGFHLDAKTDELIQQGWTPEAARKDQAETDQPDGSHLMDIPDHIHEQPQEDRQRQYPQQPEACRRVQVVGEAHGRAGILHINQPDRVIQVGAHSLIPQMYFRQVFRNLIPADQAQREDAEKGDTDCRITEKALLHSHHS